MYHILYVSSVLTRTCDRHCICSGCDSDIIMNTHVHELGSEYTYTNINILQLQVVNSHEH